MIYKYNMHIYKIAHSYVWYNMSYRIELLSIPYNAIKPYVTKSQLYSDLYNYDDWFLWMYILYVLLSTNMLILCTNQWFNLPTPVYCHCWLDCFWAVPFASLAWTLNNMRWCVYCIASSLHWLVVVLITVFS